jgi:uncharacterized protein
MLPHLAADSHLGPLIHILESEHACHTVILYGSRASGTHSPHSDYDMLGIRADGEDTRDARRIGGIFLDAFIRNEKAIMEKPQDLLHLRGGVVLRDPYEMGSRLLEEVDKALREPPLEVPKAEIEARKTWCWKTLERFRNAGPNDVEANYRRHWLLVDLLELYFVIRRRHYLGPKESFRWLLENDDVAHYAFAAALRQGAGIDEIEGVVERVVSETL